MDEVFIAALLSWFIFAHTLLACSLASFRRAVCLWASQLLVSKVKNIGATSATLLALQKIYACSSFISPVNYPSLIHFKPLARINTLRSQKTQLESDILTNCESCRMPTVDRTKFGLVFLILPKPNRIDIFQSVRFPKRIPTKPFSHGFHAKLPSRSRIANWGRESCQLMQTLQACGEQEASGWLASLIRFMITQLFPSRHVPSGILIPVNHPSSGRISACDSSLVAWSRPPSKSVYAVFRDVGFKFLDLGQFLWNLRGNIAPSPSLHFGAVIAQETVDWKQMNVDKLKQATLDWANVSQLY